MTAAWRLVLLAVAATGVVLLVGLQQGLEHAGIRSIIQASLTAFAFIPHGLHVPAGALAGRSAGVRSASPGRWSPGQAPMTMMAAGSTIYDYTLKDLAGADVPLSNYSGKIVVIVNVATRDAAAADGYAAMKFLDGKFGAQGLEVLAIPSNQFGQEPDSANWTKEIGDEITVFGKVDVNGPNADPLFTFLKKSTKSKNPPLTGNDIKDNFEKFLVDRKGKPIERFRARELAYDIQDKIQALI